MANKDYNKEDGVWRTIGGRKVFIKTNQHPMNAFIKNESTKKPFFEYNERLKKVESLEDLENLIKEIEGTGEGLLLRTKKAKWHAFSFTQVGDDKIHYLLSDGVSTRTQKIKDLYKYIEVSNNAR